MKNLVVCALVTFLSFLNNAQGQSRNCLALTNIPFGTIKCSGATHGSDCNIGCRDNYRATISSIYCYDGNWYDFRRMRRAGGPSEGLKVKLSNVRCDVERLVDDVQSVSGRSAFGSSQAEKAETCARKICSQNYDGITKGKCEQFECCWNGEAQSCHEKLCPHSYKGISKSYCEKGLKTGPTCKHSTSTSECYQVKKNSCPEGTANPPSCKPITCPSLQNVANSQSVKCSNGDSYGSKCTVTCKLGFGSVESLSATCGGDGSSSSGTWSSLPTCTRLPCMEIKSISNGRIRCGSRNKAKSTCSIGCEDGYDISVRSIYCHGADGKWHDFTRVRSEGISDSTRVNMAELKCTSDDTSTTNSRRLGGAVTGSRSASVGQCAGRISRKNCHVSYTGQTEEQCARVGCCWSPQTSSCQAKLCPSPKNYPGISKKFCERKAPGQPQCVHDREANECILAAPSQVTPKSPVVTQNVVKIPKIYQWKADLMDGSTEKGIVYEVSTRPTGSGNVNTEEDQDVVSVTEPFRSDDSLWKTYRRTACHYGGVVKVDTTDKNEINITLKYNDDWDLFHTFSMSNKKSKLQKDMLVSVLNPTSFVQIKFNRQPSRNVKERRVVQSSRPNDFLNSALDSVTLTLSRADSSIKYTTVLGKRVVNGKYTVPNLFSDAEELYLYINRSSDYKRRGFNDPKRGFGLCKVKVDAS